MSDVVLCFRHRLTRATFADSVPLPTIAATDIIATNGVIHVIGKVLVPAL